MSAALPGGRALSAPLMGHETEPTLFELSVSGRRASSFRTSSLPEWSAEELVPAELLAATADRDNAKSNATETESNILTPASKKLFQGRLETAEARLEKATKAFAAADKAWLDAKAARIKINQTNLSA